MSIKCRISRCLAAATPDGLDAEEMMYSGVDLLKLDSGKGKRLRQARIGGSDSAKVTARIDWNEAKRLMIRLGGPVAG